MKRIIFLLFTAFCLCFISKAQQKPEVLEYDWGGAFHEGDRFENRGDTAAVHILKSNTIVEYAFDGKGELNRYVLVHEKVKINNHAGLEQYKILRVNGEVLAMNARYIGKNGEILKYDLSNVKTLNRENGKFQVLAIDGAEVGGIIEYCWIRQRSQRLSGSLTMQSDVPRSNVTLSIITPNNLYFATKCYNGFPELYESFDHWKEIRILSAHADEIPALEREPHSFYDSHLQRVEYSFSHNTADKVSISHVLNEEIQSYYNTIYSLSDRNTKALQPLWKKMKITQNMTDEQKIRVIENYIKTNFQLTDAAEGMSMTKIRDILRTKYANSVGFLRLLTASFDHFYIPFELVITCNREKKFFDRDFAGNNYWEEFLIYFPSLDAYLDPGDMFKRLGAINTAYLGNDGMFLKEITGSTGSFMPYYKQIPGNDYEKSVHTMHAQLKLNTKDFSAKYSIQHQFSEYTADFLQPLYAAKDEKKKRIIESRLVNDFSPDRLLSWKVENQAPIDQYVKPLVIKTELSGNSLVSKNGNDMLIRIGTLIGKQTEMHRNSDRKLPLENLYARMYVREITLEIPDGYTLSNPEVIEMKKELLIDENVEAFFYSDYNISGNKLVITCSEGYKKATFDPSLVGEYIDVVNAGADFNKIVLVLVPR